VRTAPFGSIGDFGSISQGELAGESPYHGVRTICYDCFGQNKEPPVHWIEQSKQRIVKIAWRGIDLIYPPQCVCCRAEIDGSELAFDLCEECQKRLIPRIWTSCPRCGGQVDGQTHPQKGCSSCEKTQLHFDSVVALGGYHSELKQVVLRMKWETGAPLALAMGKLLATQRREMLQNLHPDLVIPIPLYWTHRIRRGMNSPELIAGSLAKTLEIPFRRWLLVRSKKTRTQSELPPKQRFLNVQGAFRVRFARKIRDRRILLIDDVLTTGATCSEAARILKQAGAAMVAAAVVARTQGEN
jgi:ComF family protein